MADALVQLILRARDEATVKLRAVSGEVGALTHTVNKLSGSFGIGGLALSASVGTAAALFSIGKAYAEAVEEAKKAGTTMGETREEFARSVKAADALNYQLAIMKQHFGELGGTVGKGLIGPLTTGIAVLNQVSRDVKSLFTKGDASGLLKLFATIDLPGPFGDQDGGWGAYVKGALAAKEKIHTLTDEQKAFQKAVMDVEKTFGVSAATAARFQKAIEIDKQLKHYQELHDILTNIGAIKPPPLAEAVAAAESLNGGDLTRPPVPGRRGPGTGVETVPPGWLQPADVTAANRAMAEFVRLLKEILPVVAVVRATWKDAIKSFREDSQALAAGGLNDTWRAWEFGAAGAADRVRTAWRNALADITADAVRLGLGVLLSAAGFAIGGPVGGFIGGIGQVLNPARPAAGAIAPTRGGMNVVINTSLTAPDAMAQLTAHDSPLRRALDRQIVLRRAGQD